MEYDVFLSHSHGDSPWVELIACLLTRKARFRVWFDRWRVVPGRSWQGQIADGLQNAACSVVFWGAHRPGGWFLNEVEMALDIQASNPGFLVIPVILPEAEGDAVSQLPPFLRLRDWVDFRRGEHFLENFQRLCRGISISAGESCHESLDRQRLDVTPIAVQRSLAKLRSMAGLLDAETIARCEVALSSSDAPTCPAITGSR